MKSKIFFIFVAIFIASPISALAFETENGKAIQVSSDTWLYVNTHEFGSVDEAVTIPVAAVPNWMPRMSGEYLKYQVLLGDRVFAGLDTSALVLSQAPIVGNQYVVPAGESYSFTFFALLTIPVAEDAPDKSEPVGLSIEVTSY